MGLYNVGKTVAQASAPLITGFLVAKGQFWAMFLLSGSIKVAHDLGMLAAFGNFEKSYEAEQVASLQLDDITDEEKGNGKVVN